MPSALALKLATSYKERAAEVQNQQEHFLEERRMLSALGPKRWQELRELFRETIEGINRDLGRSLLRWIDLSSDTLQIYRGASLVSGVFNEASRDLAITGPNNWDSLTYEQKVFGDDVRFVTTRRNENRPVSLEGIVEEALSKLLY